MTSTPLDQFREIMPRLDAGALTGSNQRAILDLLAAAIALAGG